MKNKLKRPLILLLLYMGLFIFLFSTDPSKLAIGWLILPFVWLFVTLFLTIYFLHNFLSTNHKRSRRSIAVSLLIAAVPTLMLLLDSIDQLTLKDGLLIIFLAVIALFYISKVSLKNTKI